MEELRHHTRPADETLIFLIIKLSKHEIRCRPATSHDPVICELLLQRPVWRSRGKLRYPDLTEQAQLKVVRIQQGNLQQVIDTVDYCLLRADNHFSCVLEFDQPFIDYIIFVDGTNHVDTITGVYFERENNCQENLKEFEYNLSGQPRTTPTLSFTNLKGMSTV